MSEYISRDTILKILADSEPKEEDWRMDNIENYTLRKIRYLAASNVYEEIKDVLSCKRLIADAAPVVHGHWFYHYNGFNYIGICSNCGKQTAFCKTLDGAPHGYPHCPYCTAKMDESENNDNE